MEKLVLKTKILALDIDNTVFDWVTYYSNSFSALLEKLSKIVEIPYSELALECHDVFARHTSIEYPFLVQELPSVRKHFKNDVTAILKQAANPCRERFMEVAHPYLKPYSGVVETFVHLRKNHPNLKILALTDAPRYVAMWKLNKLGLLSFFDAIYGLEDPKLPVIDEQVAVSSKILLRYVENYRFGFQGIVRILPNEYEKPGTRGLQTVLLDYTHNANPVQLGEILWCGDNMYKDIQLGKKLGIRTGWARYGVQYDPSHLRLLDVFSPRENQEKNVTLVKDLEKYAQPDFVLENFEGILRYL